MNYFKILLIEDEKYVSEMIQVRLEEEGYDVHTASNASDGLDMAKKIQPNLILTDLMMEGVSGIEAIKQLKKSDSTSAIPILVLTGKNLQEDRDESMRAGANGFISKPILPNRLVQEIHKFVKA